MFTNQTRCIAAISALIAAPAAAQTSNWFTYNGNYEATRYSALAQLNPSTAAQLDKTCTFDTHEQIAAQSGPVVVGGVLYVTTDTSTYAIDAATCVMKWHTSVAYAPMGFLKNNHGAAYLDGRLFRTHGGVHAYSLDAATGKVLWDVSFGRAPGEGAPMAPLAWNGLVFVGNSGGDMIGVRGHVHALDAETGRVVWTFEVIPDSGDASRTWPSGANATQRTGGGVWTSLALDPQRGVLYVPAGNPGPDFMISKRPGQNLYANSIIAIDAKSGRLIGAIQTSIADFHDWDVSAAPAVFTTRDGRPMIAVAAKDGNLKGITRKDEGFAVRYTLPTTTHLNTSTPLSPLHGTRFCPGTQGGNEWNGPAFNPGLNLLFVGAVDWCTTIRLVAADSTPDPLPMTFTGAAGGGFGKFDPKEKWQGWITAVDADAGTIAWKYHVAAPVLAGVTTTAGNVVLTGDLLGNLLVLNARTGKLLFSGATGAPIGGGVITYDVGGRQYVAAVGGNVSAIWPFPETTAHVTIFSLPSRGGI